MPVVRGDPGLMDGHTVTLGSVTGPSDTTVCEVWWTRLAACM